MSGALAARPTDKESEKGRVDATRVRRYWPGKAPEWAQADDEGTGAAGVERARTAIAAPVIVKRADDPRLRRLQAVSAEAREEALQRRREIHAAEVVHRGDRTAGGAESSSDDDEEEEEEVQEKAQKEEEGEEEIARRRQAARERCAGNARTCTCTSLCLTTRPQRAFASLF